MWAPYTHWQVVLKGEVILRQKAYFGPDYCPRNICERDGVGDEEGWGLGLF